MRTRTKVRMWRILGTLNHQVQGHHKTLDEQLENQTQIAKMIVTNSELIRREVEFAVDMANLLTDLMGDVEEIATINGHHAIAERIDARADIAGTMLKLRNEIDNDI